MGENSTLSLFDWIDNNNGYSYLVKLQNCSILENITKDLGKSIGSTFQFVLLNNIAGVFVRKTFQSTEDEAVSHCSREDFRNKKLF